MAKVLNQGQFVPMRHLAVSGDSNCHSEGKPLSSSGWWLEMLVNILQRPG